MLTIETRQLMSEHLYNEQGHINFYNGCTIIFKENLGDITGITPIGKIWTCKNDALAVSTITEWLKFWDNYIPNDKDIIIH
jgi:hypothetical protein